MINQKFVNYRINRYSGGPLIKRPDAIKRYREIEEGTDHDIQDRYEELTDFHESLHKVRNLWHPHGGKIVESNPLQIVVALDESLESQMALQLAVFMGEHYHSHLTIIYIDEEAPESALEFQTKSLLKKVTPLCKSISREVKVISHKDVALALVRESHQNNANLLVMGSHGRKGVERVELSSVAEKVLRLSESPVLINRSQTSLSQVKRILVPVDETNFSYPSIQQGIILAKDFNAELILFHVDQKNEQSSAHNTFLDLIGRMDWKQTNHELVSHKGKVVPAISQFSKEHAIDFIVMGTHLRDRHQESLTVDVIQNVTCPVWAIHP